MKFHKETSYLTFFIRNQELLDFLGTIGIKIENTDDGVFSHKMTVSLPSGETTGIDGTNNWQYPYVADFTSVSAWLLGSLLWEVQLLEPPKGVDSYSAFAKELIEILNKAGILNLDWNAVEKWSRENLANQLSILNRYDAAIETAEIEHAYGFEADIGPCEKVTIRDGQKTVTTFSYSAWDEEEEEPEDCEELKFVVTGKLKYCENREELVDYIDCLGGIVTSGISKKTNYLICNDSDSKSTKVVKAKELGIPILTELEFIKKFGDISDFDIEEEENESVADTLWEAFYHGNLFSVAEEEKLTHMITEVRESQLITVNT